MSITTLISIISVSTVVFIIYMAILLKSSFKLVKAVDDNILEDKGMIEQAKELKLIKEAKPIDTQISKNEVFKRAFERKQKMKKKENSFVDDIQEPEPPEMEEPEEITDTESIMVGLSDLWQAVSDYDSGESKEKKEEEKIKELEQQEEENNYEEYSPEAEERIERLRRQMEDMDN